MQWQCFYGLLWYSRKLRNNSLVGFVPQNPNQPIPVCKFQLQCSALNRSFRDLYCLSNVMVSLVCFHCHPNRVLHKTAIGSNRSSRGSIVLLLGNYSL